MSEARVRMYAELRRFARELGAMFYRRCSSIEVRSGLVSHADAWFRRWRDGGQVMLKDWTVDAGVQYRSPAPSNPHVNPPALVALGYSIVRVEFDFWDITNEHEWAAIVPRLPPVGCTRVPLFGTLIEQAASGAVPGITSVLVDFLLEEGKPAPRPPLEVELDEHQELLFVWRDGTVERRMVPVYARHWRLDVKLPLFDRVGEIGRDLVRDGLSYQIADFERQEWRFFGRLRDVFVQIGTPNDVVHRALWSHTDGGTR